MAKVKYHYIVKITGPASIKDGVKVDFYSNNQAKAGWVIWGDATQMTGWKPGAGVPSVGETIGITLTENHAAAIGYDALGDPKDPASLPGCFVYDAHELRLDAVDVWLAHPTAGTRRFVLGDEVELAHARPVEGVRARASFRPDLAEALGAAAGDTWEVVWRQGVGRVRAGAGWSAPRAVTLSAHVAGPASAPARPGEVGWANVHHAAGFGPGA